MESRRYEKRADWAERFALALFGSLVVQQIVAGVPITDPSVIVGAFATAPAY
ncbi:MAG: hypothetical protein HY007_00050 [Candidatus Sungbacteria bacterium]|nr:hypothetical protein [Candidatus Sungbacteria bacterium]